MRHFGGDCHVWGTPGTIWSSDENSLIQDSKMLVRCLYFVFRFELATGYYPVHTEEDEAVVLTCLILEDIPHCMIFRTRPD